MFKKFLILLLVFNTAVSFSQEMITSFPIDLKGNRDVFQIVNDTTKETTLFVSDRKKVLAFLLDEKMDIKDSTSTVRPERKYTDILGFSGEKSNPKLYWSTVGHSQLYAQFFDLKNNTVSTQDYALDLSKEKFIQAFSENKKFYVLSLITNSNFLKLYVFDEEGKLDVKTMDFSSFKLFRSKSNYGSVSEVFARSIGELNTFENAYKIAKITTDSPTSLSDSAKKRKCYSNGKEITITLDFNDAVTQLIVIDLQTLTPSFFEISKPKLNTVSSSDDLNSNSFLYGDHLFQFTLSPYKMHLTVKDLKGNLIKEYAAGENETVTFKNSDFLRQNHLGSERQLETTAQFLRKVNRSNVGVSAYEWNGKYLITLGSVSPERPQGGGMSPMGGGMGMMGGGGMGMHFSGGFYMGMYFSPTFGKLDSYANRKVIYFDSLLDKDFNHTNDKIADIAFDKMQAFVTKYPEIDSETIFKLNTFYYLGYYDKMAKSYILQKFTD